MDYFYLRALRKSPALHSAILLPKSRNTLTRDFIVMSLAPPPSRRILFPSSSDSINSHSSKNIPKIKTPGSLAKRLLFPHIPAGSELPSLLINEDPQLNAELYDFLVLSLRGFVLPWWSKLSKYDKELLPEITRVVAVLLRSIEARLALVDLPDFFLNKVPPIITQHYADYRNARSKLGSSYATGGSFTLPLLFHHLQPHMAISADGRPNETYMRQIVDHIMKATLPPQDWDAEVERAILREIILKFVLGSAFDRLAQPWFIHKMFIDLLDLFFVSPPTTKPDLATPAIPSRHFSLHKFIVVFLSTIQTISGLCLAIIALSQKVMHAVRHINASTNQTANLNVRYSNLARRPLQMFAEILTMRSRASSLILLSFLDLYTGLLYEFLDRALPFLLSNYVFTSSQLTRITIQFKNVLFPNGYPNPPPPEPSSEEQILLREQLELRLSTALPVMLLGSDEETRRRTTRDIIEPLSSRECNIHLLVFLLDAIVLTIFPELGILSVKILDCIDVNNDDSPFPSVS